MWYYRNHVRFEHVYYWWITICRRRPTKNLLNFKDHAKKKKKMRSLVLWFGLMRDDDNKTHLSYANFTYSSYKCTIYVLVYYYTCKTSDCKTIYNKKITSFESWKLHTHIIYVCILLMFMKYCHFPKCPFSKLFFDLTAVILYEKI